MRRSRRRRRPAIALLIVLVLVGVFVTRLVDVQVVSADALNAASKNKRSVTEVVQSKRGTITAADGTVLARSVPRYTVIASPQAAHDDIEGDLSAAAARIAAAIGGTKKAVLTALASRTSQYSVLGKNLSLARFEAVKRLGYSWLYYDETQVRIYPNGAVAGNLVGFVGSSGEAQAGVEYSANQCLAGTDGAVSYERAADDTPIPGTAVETKAAKAGGSVTLTINSDLQWFTQQVLATQAKKVGAKWGVVVVEDAKTGKLLTVADWPSVDPNNVNATASNDTAALGSRAFTASYEPGSTLKTLTAAALVDAGHANPQTRVLAPYRLITTSGANVNDSEYHADERLTLTGVLVQSSNTGMSKLGLRMSNERRYQYLKAFGLGTATAVGFGAEATGDLGANAPNWDAQSQLATMFGQGLTVSAVQMASVYATIANGGVREPLSLVERCTAADGTVTTPTLPAAKRVVSAKTARTVVNMLENVDQKAWLADMIQIKGYRVAIKTGTAQESDGHGGYSKGYLVSLAGIAPADNPRYVVYVALNDAVKMNNSGATAPVFRQVMARVLQQYGSAPSGSSSPDLPTNY